MTDEELKQRFDALRIQGTKTNKKRTEEDLRARFDYLQAQNQAQQPVQQVTQPVAQPVAQPVVQQPTVTSHAQKAQQGLEQAQAKLHATEQKATPMTDKINSGVKLTNPADIIQLAKEQGKITDEEAQYQLKRANARNTPVANTYAAKENYEKAKQEPVKAVDREQGKKDAEKVDMTDVAKSYMQAKEDLQEAKDLNNERDIAKNEAIIEKAKDKYKANEQYSNIDIPRVKTQLQGLILDLRDTYAKIQAETDPEIKNRLIDEYNNTLQQYQDKYKTYNEAVTYDELVNNNFGNDIAQSGYLGLAGGGAKLFNGAYALGSRLSNANADQINADELLRYNNNEANWTDTVQDIGNALGKLNLQQLPANLANRLLGNEKQTANSAYTQLQRVALLNPNNIGIQRLYRDITNHTYKGTAEDLRNELDKIQKEIYQGFKDLGTQSVIDKEREQLQHNEIYGNLAMIPNAVNTATNMVASQALAPTGGEIVSLTALGLGAGSQGLDEALQSGARYNQAFDYGVLTGLAEVGTEKMFESGINRGLGIRGAINPENIANSLIDSLGVKNGIARAIATTAGDVAGESVEEMVSEAVNPFIKYVTYDKNALPENPQEYFKSILNAGLEAIPSTLLMEGVGAGTQVVKVNQITNGVIKSINESDLSPIVKTQLINEAREAAKEVKKGIQEEGYIGTRANEKLENLTASSNDMKARIPQGYTLPQSTIDILAYTENNRPGLNIAFDTNIQGNGTFVENPDGTRTITLNPNSKRAVEFILTHELGHDLKGTGEYTQLQNLLTDYAKGKPGYQNALNQLDKTYKESGVSYNLQDEATNDMLGQAIGEQEFYNKLAENPTLFNRVTNGLKNLLGNKDTKLKNKIEKLTSNALKQEYREAAQDVLFSKQNASWQQFLDKNLNLAKGTRTNFEGLPSNEELQRAGTKSVENEPIVNQVKLNKTNDDTLFSLSDEEQKEVSEWADEFEKDNTIDPEFASKVWQEFSKIKDYVDFEELKEKVEQYKEKAYGINTEQKIEKPRKIENKYSDEVNERIQRVNDYIADWKTAEGKQGKLKSKDVKGIIEQNVGKERGNSKVINSTIKSMNEDMQQGNLTDNKIDEYVDKLGKDMKSYITDYYDTYKDLKQEIKNTKIYTPNELKRGITDFNTFRRKNMSNLSLTSDRARGQSVDQVYKELQEMYPDMFPDDIYNPIDQLEYLSELSSGITKQQGALEDMLDKQYGRGAWESISNTLKQQLKELRDNQANSYMEEDKISEDKKRSWTDTSKSNQLVREFLDVKDMIYVPESNKKQIKYAQNQIDRLGYDEAIKYIDNKISMNERFKTNDIAMCELLIQEAIKHGDFEKAQDLISDVAIIGTELGQSVQALSLIARMTPEGQLKYLNKVMNKINDKIDNRNSKRSEDKQIPNITLDKESAANILKATNELELQQAMDEALQKIADQMQVSFSDKIAEWRYLAMLANPRTHFRNVLANVAMRGTYETKNAVQRVIETIASPLLEERTRTFKKATSDVKKFAEQSTKDNANRLSGNKERGIESRLKEMQKVFKTVPLEKLRRLNSDWLSKEDNIFTYNAYKQNLAEYLTANGIKTQHDIDMNPELVQKGINFATEEAFKTTFHQASKLANALNNIENSSAFAKLFVGGSVPFKKTPINIAKTGAAYSPLGLFETLGIETYRLKKGDITANEFIDRLSQGFTGSALFEIGALLAKFGILKAGADDEDYEESIGKTKEYSIRLGDKNFDISWLAPSGIPLLMGAELVGASKDGETNINALLQSLEKSINPLSEMSLLQGVNSTLQSYSNQGIGGQIGSVVENAFKSYFGQFLPTIGGQVNKIIDDTQRVTTASKDSKWRAGESFARQQLNKIPGGSFLLEPKTDVWGREVKRDSNPAIRAFDALINPGTVTKDNSTRVDDEILSVFSKTGEDIKPTIPKAEFTYNGEKVKLNAKDYTKYKKTVGQYMYDTYDALLDSEAYKSLREEERAKILEKIAKDSINIGKAAVGTETKDYSKYEVIKDELDKAGIPLADYYLFASDITGNTKKGTKQTIIRQRMELLNEMNGKDTISKEDKSVLYDIFGVN